MTHSRWHRSVVAIVLLCAAACATKISACTIFKITIGGRTYMGNNEAWNDPATRMWFLPAEAGKFGRVAFGYRNGYTQGGMNEKGLCYDWVAGYKTGWVRDAAKPDYAGNLGEKALEEATTVDEAIAILAKYNYTDYTTARAFFVDRSGASAVVGYEDGKFVVTRGKGTSQAVGWEEDETLKRLRAIAESAGGRSDVATIEAVSGVLGACQQSGTYSTLYSNVCDLEAGDVYVYQFAGKVPAVKFNLAAELAKGLHFYELPKIQEQMKRAPAQDGKTITAVEIDPLACAAIAGDYVAAGGMRIKVLVKDGRPLVWLPGEAAAREVFAASKTKYFLRMVDIQFAFELDESGRASKLKIHTWQADIEATRVATVGPAKKVSFDRTATVRNRPGYNCLGKPGLEETASLSER
ncbi:MAG: hypothetical protein AABZ53_10710 [Planctomycetota bacterium]